METTRSLLLLAQTPRFEPSKHVPSSREGHRRAGTVCALSVPVLDPRQTLESWERWRPPINADFLGFERSHLRQDVLAINVIEGDLHPGFRTID
jgi:hypothetical protein